MTNLTRYRSADLPNLFDQIVKNSIGMDDYFDRVFTQQQQSNYPPYNLVQLSNVESRLELALAGFKLEEVHVYTQDGKLFVEGTRDNSKDEETTFIHRGLAQRSFTRTWTLSDETEVGSVTFENGLLTVTLCKIVPEHHQRKDYL